MRDSWGRALPVLAGLLLITVVLAFVREYGSGWGRVQSRYPSVRAAHGLLPPARDEFRPGVQQIYLPALGRIDRCSTCHLGIDNPRLAGAPEPYTAHPGDYLERHPPDRFGCTICHGGEGAALEEREAHGRARHSASPLTPKELIESSCGVCHLGVEVPGAPLLSRGRRLMDEYSCQACHEVPGLTTQKFLGPSWDDVGRKVTREWLARWLEDPHGYLKRPRMPRFRLRPAERTAIVEFLLEFTGVPGEPGASSALEGNAERGGVLFRESRCITCHSVRGRGGTIGPDLGTVAGKVTPEWLVQFIRNPHFFQPTTPMPRFGFTDGEIRDLIAYILTEFVAEEESAPRAVERVDPALLDRMGREAFTRYGCLSCHALAAMASPGKIGPDLSRIGSRSVDELVFAPPDTAAHTLSAWIFEKVRSPSAADSTARMPEYGFEEADIAAITVALLSLRGEEVPEGFRVHAGDEGGHLPQGKAGELFRNYRCLSCHQLYGRGGTIARAPLDFEGSKARREWLVDYLEEPYAVRVLIPERMPKLKITREEAELLADYMGLVFVSDRVAAGSEFRASPGEAEAGRRSFESRGCRGCHILGETGGYVGPQLNSTGIRLDASWVTEWLLDPRHWVPETIHPDYGMSREEAHALAAYLDTFRAGPR